MKKAFYNFFDEMFDRSLYYGMNYNPHWNRNFKAASPQDSDCTSQFVKWTIMNDTERALSGRRGEAASLSMIIQLLL